MCSVLSARTDIIGKTFGNLTVLALDRVNNRSLMFLCMCTCGKRISVAKHNLTSGRTKHCKSCILRSSGSNSKSWRGGRHVSGSMFNRIKLRAEKDNIDINVDIEYLDELIENQNFICAISGVLLQPITTVYIKGKVKRLGNMSLDRIDSSLGYIKGNLQWVDK